MATVLDIRVVVKFSLVEELKVDIRDLVTSSAPVLPEMHSLNGKWRLRDYWLRLIVHAASLYLDILLEMIDIVNELIVLFLFEYLDDLLKLVNIRLLSEVLNCLYMNTPTHCSRFSN
jgi:hypothetical protein